MPGAVTSRGRRRWRRAGAEGGQPCTAPRPGVPKYPTRPLPDHSAKGKPLPQPRSSDPPSPSRARGGDLSSNRWKRRTATRPPPSDDWPAHSPPILLLRRFHPQAHTTAPYSPRASSDALPCRARPLHNSRASASTPGLAKARGRGDLWEL